MLPLSTPEGRSRCNGKHSRPAQPAKAKATGSAKPTPSGTPDPWEVYISLPRDDSDAEEDWLTPKVMSESLSSWEPLKDPDGVVVSGLDCRVPGSQRDSMRGVKVAQALPVPAPHPSAALFAALLSGEQIRVTVQGSVDVADACILPVQPPSIPWGIHRGTAITLLLIQKSLRI